MGTIITEEYLQELKSKIEQECARRSVFKSTNRLEYIDDSWFEGYGEIKKGNIITNSHYDQLFIPLRKINEYNDYWYNREIINIGDDINYLTELPTDSEITGCYASSCMGLCRTGCYYICESHCGTECSSECMTNCVTDCSEECYVDCTGLCKASCHNECGENCSYACGSGCGSDCQQQCRGGCGGDSCKGGCYQHCHQVAYLSNVI